MEMNHLRYFYEVAKAGSFTAASKRLRISQPSLSKSVAQLEDREGVRLLDRGKKGVTLTPMGEMAYAKCEGIFKELDDLSDQMRGGILRCEGPLKMGISDHLANYLFPPILSAFHGKHPKVVPDIYTGTPMDIVSMIARRELEFGVFFTRVSSPTIEYTTVGKIEFVTVCSASIRKEALKQSDKLMIGSRTIDYLKNHPIQGILGNAEKESKPLVFETNNQELQKRLCLVGYGVAALPRFMVAEELRKKDLFELPHTKPMTADILVAKKKGQTLSVPAQKFYETLKASLSQ